MYLDKRLPNALERKAPVVGQLRMEPPNKEHVRG